MLGAHLLPELHVLPLLLLDNLFGLLSLLHLALPQQLQVISLVVVRLKRLLIYLHLSYPHNYPKSFEETTVPVANVLEVDVTTVTPIELTDRIAILIDGRLEKVTWSA